MPFVITDQCVDITDRSCVEQCPVDCIYEGARMLYIHPDECIDCGACAPVCPQEAIYLQEDLPADKAHFATINVEFFEIEGHPTLPAGEGETGPDHPLIAALPRAVGS